MKAKNITEREIIINGFGKFMPLETREIQDNFYNLLKNRPCPDIIIVEEVNEAKTNETNEATSKRKK